MKRPSYSADYLRYLLDRLEDDSKCSFLSDIKNKIAIPAYRIGECKEGEIPGPVLYHNCFDCPEKDEEISEAVLKSSAAPTYFSSVGGCIDG